MQTFVNFFPENRHLRFLLPGLIPHLVFHSDELSCSLKNIHRIILLLGSKGIIS